MSKLSMGGRFMKQEEIEAMEQQRLIALLEITDKHNAVVAELTRQLEQAKQQAERAVGSLKSEKQAFTIRLREQDDALKALRAFNPERMKKQTKRLQEQNRVLTAEVNTQKSKNKQLNEQLQKVKLELEQATAESEEVKQVA